VPRKAKTPKFAAFARYDNCFGYADQPDLIDMAGNRPIVLEVGCGRAELGLELARRHPDSLIIGIDIKSDRMYRPAETALAENLTNIVFVRSTMQQFAEILPDNAVDEIWITFPDPHPKKRASKHRLTGAAFQTCYRQLLKPSGLLRLKTDNDQLFAWSISAIEDSGLFQIDTISYDLHQDFPDQSDECIETTYERRYRAEGKLISYLLARPLN
jgi:tRNA (guanine-N7-)-methyltransferase